MSILTPLVTLTYAKIHCRTNVESDSDLLLKLLQATQIVMNHIKKTDVPAEWKATAIPAQLTAAGIPANFIPSFLDPTFSPPENRYVLVPGNVQAAIILATSEAFEKREASVSEILSDDVLSLLEGFRDPTLA